MTGTIYVGWRYEVRVDGERVECGPKYEDCAAKLTELGYHPVPCCVGRDLWSK